MHEQRRCGKSSHAIDKSIISLSSTLVLLPEWKRKCRRVHRTFEMSSNSFNRFTGNEPTNDEWTTRDYEQNKALSHWCFTSSSIRIAIFSRTRTKPTKIRSKKLCTHILHRCSTHWGTQSLYLSFTFFPHLHITHAARTHTPNTRSHSHKSQ